MPRPQVALVTSAALPALYDDDRPLIPALAALGVDARPAVWTDPAIDWPAFDAVVIRSPWDYFMRVDEFRAWLAARLADGTRLHNSGRVLTWNFDKGYLAELAAAGVTLVPTIVVPQGEPADVAARAGARGWDDVVVKPTISGGAYRLHRFRLADEARFADELATTLAGCGLLIQPFLPAIETGGELSLLFFGGAFSHAVRKRPAPGEFRVQFMFGGTSEPAEVRPAWIAAAEACLAAMPGPTVYARVDGVIDERDQFLLMELEVFEPVMYLADHPEATDRFARAIAAAIR